MSASASASIRVERNANDTASVLIVTFVVDGIEHHNGVSIPDGSTGQFIADRLDVLSFWIGERVKK